MRGTATSRRQGVWSFVFVVGIFATTAHAADVDGGDKAKDVEHGKDRVGQKVIKVDLDIDGVQDTDEVNVGGFVGANENAPRKKIILRKAEPDNWTGNLILTRNNTRVKVYDAQTGGNEITFNGTNNKFANNTLPKSLWVQGESASQNVRDVQLELKAEGSTTGKDLVKFTVLQVNIAFQTAGMGGPKVIPNPGYQRIGVLKGDSITFSAALTPAVTLAPNEYAWSGEATGNGSSIPVTFNASLGTRTEQLQVLGQTKTATIRVMEVTPPDQATWAAQMALLHWDDPLWVPRINDLANEASAWAAQNWETLGGTAGLHNCKADAARHAYWNVLMIIEGYGAGDAWGAGEAHERTGIVGGAPHNESVMDLENNQKGINMGAGLTTRAAAQAAVIGAVGTGNLTYLDDVTNSGERGLLQPTNK